MEKQTPTTHSQQKDAEAWRPIETAPKDEVWGNGQHVHGPLILAYPVWGKVDTVYWWQTKDGRASNFLDGGGNAVHPRHWMPLPDPPGVNPPEGETDTQYVG